MSGRGGFDRIEGALRGSASGERRGGAGLSREVERRVRGVAQEEPAAGMGGGLLWMTAAAVVLGVVLALASAWWPERAPGVVADAGSGAGADVGVVSPGVDEGGVELDTGEEDRVARLMTDPIGPLVAAAEAPLRRQAEALAGASRRAASALFGDLTKAMRVLPADADGTAGEEEPAQS